MQRQAVVVVVDDARELRALVCGCNSSSMCQAELAECKTIIWNGPMGVFEMEKFAKVLPLLAVLVQEYKKVQTSEVHFFF